MGFVRCSKSTDQKWVAAEGMTATGGPMHQVKADLL